MLKIDLFCHVIDNYGDIGVCWRLARQLVAEHGCAVRLIVDDLNAFRVIAPEIDPAVDHQTALGVDVTAWSATDNLAPSDVVIEAFACDPPPRYVEAMAARTPKPVWLNLEYLSAEAWVDEVHGMPSQHQRLPLTKYFFCPGFTEQSGGLIRESNLTASGPRSRSAGEGWGEGRSATAQHENQISLNPPPPPLSPALRERAPLRLFAFTYPHAPVRALALALSPADLPTQVTLAAPLIDADPTWQTAQPVPQTGFDALLAQFDFLIVRGEDSFVRAQWAAKPFLWHIYPTADNAHLTKLDAWLHRYCIDLEPSVAAAYRAASHAFNRAETSPEPYIALAQALPHLTAHAALWRASLMQQTDLATRLPRFCDLVKSQKLG